jgi:hypothetical protein
MIAVDHGAWDAASRDTRASGLTRLIMSAGAPETVGRRAPAIPEQKPKHGVERLRTRRTPAWRRRARAGEYRAVAARRDKVVQQDLPENGWVWDATRLPERSISANAAAGLLAFPARCA